MTSERSLNTYYLGFNCSRPPFNDVNMRKAVARAVDRAKILKSFYEARGRLAKGPVPDILRDWTINEKNGYDPENARRMIRAANGYKRDINFYITSDQEVVDIAEIIQSYLRQAGLNIRIKQLEWSAYKEALNNGEADMFWIGWWADYPDPENFLFPLFHSSNHGASGNRTRYTNKEVDRLIEAGQREIDPKKRDLYYMNAENFIVDDSPCVFFWHKTDFVLRQPGLKNFRMYPIYSMDKGTETSF